MAGIAAARGDNGIGVRGVAPHAKIMPVRVLDDAGAGSTETIVAGIAYALRQGARVINLSLNGPEHSQALDEAIRAAERNGVVVVVSAGNAGQNIDRTPSYPASSSSPNVIAVAAGSRDGGLTAFSGWGRAGVDLAAPGEGVLSTSLGGGYSTGSGTSEAAAECERSHRPARLRDALCQRGAAAWRTPRGDAQTAPRRLPSCDRRARRRARAAAVETGQRSRRADPGAQDYPVALAGDQAALEGLRGNRRRRRLPREGGRAGPGDASAQRTRSGHPATPTTATRSSPLAGHGARRQGAARSRRAGPGFASQSARADLGATL